MEQDIKDLKATLVNLYEVLDEHKSRLDFFLVLTIIQFSGLAGILIYLGVTVNA